MKSQAAGERPEDKHSNAAFANHCHFPVPLFVTRLSLFRGSLSLKNKEPHGDGFVGGGGRGGGRGRQFISMAV